MTVPLHSHEFFSGRVTATPTILYTVPTGNLIVIKSIHLLNAGSTSKQAIVSVDNAWLILAPILGANGTSTDHADWSGWLALKAARVIRMTFSGTASIDCNISGYLYPVTL